MNPTTLALALLASVIGTFFAGVVGCYPGAKMYRASAALLGGSAALGLLVGIAVATTDVSSLILPAALYPHAVESVTWPLFYTMNFGLDQFSAIFYSVLCLITLVVSLYTVPYLEHYTHDFNPRHVSVLTALLVFAMQGLLLSTNIVGFMVFWEIMSVASFFIVLADGSPAARRAGFLYLAMTHLCGGAVMAGLFLLSGGALLSDFSVIAMITPELPTLTMYVALGLLLFGFGSKAGLVPFHVWLPEAYAEAPTHATALLSGTMASAVLYGFLRVLLFLLPGVPMWFVLAILLFGAVSAIVGVLYAALERDIKRLLAYSSIEHTGLVFTMIGVALLAGQEGSVELTQSALYAAIFLIIAHALVKTGLFLVSGVMIAIVRSRRLEAMGGLAKRMPQFSVTVCVLVLAAAAMPPFAPFMSEWTFIQSMVGALSAASSTLKVALVGVLSLVGFVSGLTLFAMIKMYAIAFLAQPRSDEAAAATEPLPGLALPIMALAFLSLLLGLFSPWLLNRIGAVNLASEDYRLQVLTAGGSGLAPLHVLLVMIMIVVVLVVLRRLVSNVKYERVYQTWDGGQPITSRMEYTATGFSAPIRYFFRFFLRTQKVVTTTPLTPSNPWLASRSMSLLVSQVWYERLYMPFGAALTRLAGWVGRLQNGSVQFYISLILVALLVTLIVAL